jgi:hypothetical protein
VVVVGSWHNVIEKRRLSLELRERDFHCHIVGRHWKAMIDIEMLREECN